MKGKKTFYTLMVDGQDGGGNTYLFSSEKERFEFLKRNDEWNEIPYNPENHDDYEDGYMDEEIIEWEIIIGELHFIGEISFHWGQ